MTQSFMDLKKNRKSQFDKLANELAKQSSNAPQQEEDNRFWKPTVDKADTGFAVIRFLPAPQNEDVPYVRIWDHGFKGPGGWFIENSLTTLGLKDPVSEYNSKLWNSGLESDKELVRKQKRRLTYISNILVIKDPGNPDNEGRVFLFRYGKKIFDKLNDAMHPKFEDEEPINPFDMWEGANFRLKIRKVDGYRNYDQSSFDAPKPITDDDDMLKRIWESEHSLQAFLDPKLFKSYEELQARLNKALGFDNDSGSLRRPASVEVEQPKSVRVKEDTPPWDEDSATVSGPIPKKPATRKPDDDEDDEGMAFFKSLIEE